MTQARSAEEFQARIDSVLDQWREKDRIAQDYWHEDFMRRLAALGVPPDMAHKWLARRVPARLQANSSATAAKQAHFPKGALI